MAPRLTQTTITFHHHILVAFPIVAGDGGRAPASRVHCTGAETKLAIDVEDAATAPPVPLTLAKEEGGA